MRRISFFTCIAFVLLTISAKAQQKEPWKDSQLVRTADLAARIGKGTDEKLHIISIGPDAVIKGSVDIGPTREAENMAKLKTFLKAVPKDEEVIIYCGCCPFSRCPNIRPAFSLLDELGYVNAKLLDIPKNIKADWLDKDYPVNE